MNARDRQFWTEFLLLYRSLPAVWKVKSPEYSSRALKSSGYEELVEKLREVEPHADRALVIKKINSFRTNFRRDMRRREHCSSEEDPFESTLWYFELLGFLADQEDNGSCQSLDKNSRSSEPEVHTKALHFVSYDEPKPKKCRTTIKEELTPSPTLRSHVHSPVPIYPSSHKRRRLDKRSLSTLSQSEALAHTWRSQFDELAPRQKLLARKLISDVLYYGCMDQLEPSHVTRLQDMMLQRSPSPQLEDVLATSPDEKLHSLDKYEDSDTYEDD